MPAIPPAPLIEDEGVAANAGFTTRNWRVKAIGIILSFRKMLMKFGSGEKLFAMLKRPRRGYFIISSRSGG